MRKLRSLALSVAVLALFASAGLGQAVNNGAVPVTQTALSTTVKTVKGAPGVLAYAVCNNPNAAPAFLQVFDVATSGGVTLGTTAPNLIIPFANSTPTVFVVPNTVRFNNGIQVAATTTATGNTALGTAINCSFGIY